MNLPKKCGDMHIKLDDNNEPEYGFEVSGNKIINFVKLCDKPIEEIVLPRLADDIECPRLEDNSTFAPYTTNMQKKTMKKYVNGNIKICDGCFSGLKKATIVVPFENSVMLDWGSFDRDAEIEFVVPEDYALKQVYRRFDAGYDYEHENWTLIADKNLDANFEYNSLGHESYCVMDYNEEDLRQVVAEFKLGKKLKKEDYAIEEVEEQLTIL